MGREGGERAGRGWEEGGKRVGREWKEARKRLWEESGKRMGKGLWKKTRAGVGQEELGGLILEWVMDTLDVFGKGLEW